MWAVMRESMNEETTTLRVLVSDVPRFHDTKRFRREPDWITFHNLINKVAARVVK